MVLRNHTAGPRAACLMHSTITVSPTFICITIAALAIEALCMWLLLSGAPISKPALVAYHHVIALWVAYVAARVLLQASTPGSFNAVTVVVFTMVLLVFNPLYPLLLTTMHTIVADVVLIVLLLWFFRRQVLAGQRVSGYTP